MQGPMRTANNTNGATSYSHRPVWIVTDSTADIPDGMANDLPITIVPLTVEVGGRSYRDGIDLSRDEFVERLRAGEWPRTSQPSVGAFRQTYIDLLEQGFDILSIHIASSLSGTCNAAQSAAAMTEAERIRIIDSETVSMGFGWLALLAGQLARQGGGLDEVASAIERRKGDQRVFAMLDTLEYLHRGGRIGRSASLLGSALRIKPIIEICYGAVEPRERVRTTRRALDRLVAIAEDQQPWEQLAVMHLGAEDASIALTERLAEQLPDLEIVRGQLGTVIGAYGGPGLVGIAGLARPTGAGGA